MLVFRKSKWLEDTSNSNRYRTGESPIPSWVNYCDGKEAVFSPIIPFGDYYVLFTSPEGTIKYGVFKNWCEEVKENVSVPEK